MVDCVQSGYGNGRTTGKFCITTLVIRIICADGKSSPWHVMLIDEWAQGSISASDKVFQCVLLFAFRYLLFDGTVTNWLGAYNGYVCIVY